MKPYLGILIDSFWETVSSKVLWALLGASTIVLIALTPFGLTIERGFKLANHDINSAEKAKLLDKLTRGLDGQASPGVQAVAGQLDKAFQQRLRKRQSDPKSGDEIRTRELADELNRILTSRQLYTSEAFPNTAQIDRYKELINQLPSEISNDDLQELNRRLLTSAFPAEINPTRGEQIWFSYGGFKIGDALPLSRKQVRQVFEPLVLVRLLKLGLAILVVFVAIIMTSWIIPDTFRSGLLHLMLSKPISRSGLFLSKFLGGCIFISLNLIYVVVGLYFMVGFRFEIWNQGIIGCIPLLLFVFVIFYSVSALVGLIWGNAIICIVACMIFWAFCFSLGVAHSVLREPVEYNQLVNRIAEIEGHLLTVNETGQLSVWNEQQAIWQPAVSLGGGSLTLGPIYDAQRRTIFTKSFRLSGPFGQPFSSGSRQLTLIDIDDFKQIDSSGSDADGQPRAVELDTLRETGYWNFENGPDIPAQVSDMVRVTDQVIVVCRSGLYRLDMNSQDKQVISGRLAEMANQFQKWIGSSSVAVDLDGPFRLVSPPDFSVTNNTAVAATRQSDGLIAYTSGRLSLMNFSEQKFTVTAKVDLEGEGTEAAIVASDQAFCAIARDGLPIEIFDAQLNLLHTLPLPSGQAPKSWTWIPGSQHQLALVTQEGLVWTIDCLHGTLEKKTWDSLGKITCISWLNDQQAYLGIAPNQVLLVDLTNLKVQKKFSPQLRRYEWVYQYIIQPLYRLNPKPGALDGAMVYLLTGKKEIDDNLVTNKIESSKRELEIWQPIISNLIFVMVMLSLSCIYVARKEY